MIPAEGQAAKKRQRARKRKRRASQTLTNGSSHADDSRGEGGKELVTEGGKPDSAEVKQKTAIGIEKKETQIPGQKKRRRRSKQRQTSASTNNTASPQSQQVEGRMSMAAGKEGEVIEGWTVTPTAGEKQEEPKKKRKRKRKKMNVQEDTSSTPAQSQSSDTTASKTPEEQNKRKRKKRNANSSAGVGNKERKDATAGEEEVAAKKLKKGTPEGARDPPKDETVSDAGKETPKKKNRRKRKKKRKVTQVDDDSTGVSVNEGKDGVMNQDVKKAEKGTLADAPDVQKGRATDTTGSEEPVKGKKRKRRKRKSNQIDSNENKEEEEEVPAKKLKNKKTPDGALDSQQKGTPHVTGEAAPSNQNQADKPNLTASQKRNMRKKKRKAEERKQTNNTLPGCSKDPQTTSRKRKHSGQQTPILHPSCRSQENKEKIMSCWTTGSKKGVVLEGEIEVIKNPFSCCYISNLLENEEFLEGVKNEVTQIQLINKNNDLYKFRQTKDLKGVTSPFLSGLRHLLHTDVRQGLIDVTGIPLNDTMDMSCSVYKHTDVLLCHDDELEGRRIAYILYLVPPWDSEDGGSLDLFSTDEHGQPKDIVRSLVPKFNAFAFFEVSPVSFHQVSEVLSRDKTRLSINGWFHGPPIPRPKRNQPPLPPLQGPGQFEEEDFYAWINPFYLDMETQKEIQHKFCSDSQIELENFLTEEAYEKLSKAFSGGSLAWEHKGPADAQSYEILDPDNMPQEIKECWQFLKCEAFFLVVSQLTGLKLHPLASQDSDDEESDEETSEGEPNPRGQVEAQRWSHRCYTLIRDDCVDRHSALDAYLYANVSKHWSEDLGGHVTYVAKDEDEELLTVIPRSNCLSLVYRDTQTLKFTKYINTTAFDSNNQDDSNYHSFACVYYE